jgi:predicted tellurium resistance membrane protein TerC
MLHLLADAQAADPGLFTPAALIALLTLTLLEIVLGIDNIVFIAILCARLPESMRARARQVGLSLALVTRVAFLSVVTYIIKLAEFKLVTLSFLSEKIEQEGHLVKIPMEITGKDAILILGGLFLLWKAVHEIHAKVEGPKQASSAPVKVPSFNAVIAQILLIDIVFSIDSVITAVGMAQQLWVMITAVIISVLIMMAAAGTISAFIDKHPTLKVLALSFLLLIGFVLVAEGFGQHIEKGYIYFAMAFSLVVEMINIKVRARTLAMP